MFPPSIYKPPPLCAHQNCALAPWFSSFFAQGPPPSCSTRLRTPTTSSPLYPTPSTFSPPKYKLPRCTFTETEQKPSPNSSVTQPLLTGRRDHHHLTYTPRKDTTGRSRRGEEREGRGAGAGRKGGAGAEG